MVTTNITYKEMCFKKTTSIRSSANKHRPSGAHRRQESNQI